MKYIATAALIAIAAQPLAADDEAAEQTRFVAAVEEARQAAKDETDRPMGFETAMNDLLSMMPQDASGYYVVDGDLRLEAADIREVVRQSVTTQRPDKPKFVFGELVLNTVDGQPLCHATGADRRLTYTIDIASFANAVGGGAVAEIRADLAAAAKDWESACPSCEIAFVELDAEDPEAEGAYFEVRYVGDQDYIAAAFFPGDEKEMRNLVIASDFYATPFPKVGVLRHELGHVLGYRHEHIRPEQAFGCFNPLIPSKVEETNWVPLGKYDANSVMHYLCGGGGTTTLELSDDDKTWHRLVYGELGVCPSTAALESK